MFRMTLYLGAVVVLSFPFACRGGLPEVRMLPTPGGIAWNSGDNPGLVVLETTTNFHSGPWFPVWYDLPTNAWRSTQLPASRPDNSFYRLRVQSGPADTNLLLHLPFDNHFSEGIVVDASGGGSHGFRYGRPCCQTNWPSATTGPDGSQAGNFNWYADGFGKYGRSGDYVVITNVTPFMNLRQMTVSAWARYRAAYGGSYLEDHNSTILYSGHATRGVWNLGRNYSHSTSFTVFYSVTDAVTGVYFPDNSLPDGDTDRWNHYLVTFDQGLVKGYFNGVCFSTNVVPVLELTAAGTWLGVACWTFNKDPWLDLSVDLHPNNAWVNGTMDDLRIYNRVLDNAEVQSLYYSFDKTAPAPPAGLSLRAESSSQVTLRWAAASDDFGVVGYQVIRDGLFVGQTSGTYYLDENLQAGQQYSYALRSFDHVGNRSIISPPAHVTTLPVSGAVDTILDNRDPAPWVNPFGGWSASILYGGYYGADYLDDANTGKGTKWVTFRPSVPVPGNYQIFLRWTARSNRATNTPVVVSTSTLTNTVFVNQTLFNNLWVSLGSYQLTNGTGSTIEIRNDGTTGRVIVDAIRLVK